MNYSGTIAWKAKRCHWPLKAVEADGGVASGRAGRGGVMSASGMGGGETEEAGAETERRDEGGRGEEETGWGFSFVL